MEYQFHIQFFKTEPETSLADLARLRQDFGETAEQFLDRFKRSKNKCHVLLPESEFAKLALNALDLERRKKFEGMEFRDVFELSARVAGKI